MAPGIGYAEPQDSPPPTEASVAEASAFYDAGFDQHVDLRLLGVAWQTLDAKLFTDVALQLREAERVLGRQHSLLQADPLLEFAAKMASAGKDRLTLQRLVRVAVAAGDEQRALRLQQMANLTAQARDLREEPMFSAEEVNRGAVAAFGNLTLQIRAAELAGDSEALKNLRQGVKELQALGKSHRDRLYGVIDDTEQLIGDKDETSDLLHALTGPARDFGGARIAPGNPGGSGLPAQGSPLTGGVAAAKVMIDNRPQPPSGSVLVSFATGGMRHIMTPSGAVVQSHGRLGPLLFEPGDVILAIGGLSLHPGTSVDAGVNQGYLFGNRTVVVRDRRTGNVLELFF